MMALIICAVVGVNAQTAYQSSKVLDNVSVGVTGGISSPLDFNSVTPFNTNFGLKVQKDFTPVVGVQIEGLAILNDNHFTDSKTWVKASNVGLNGVINISNLIGGYKGTPRFFEASAVAGLGWLHFYGTSKNAIATVSDFDLPRVYGTAKNALSAKTGVDLAFNLGANKEHSIVLTPAVYWALTNVTEHTQFNKNHAQLAVNVSYVYHFKTSNGTHHFKTFNVGDLNSTIKSLRDENSVLKNGVKSLADENSSLKKDLASKPNATSSVETVDRTWVIEFAQGSSSLDAVAKEKLNTIPSDATVNIEGTASKEGSAKVNKKVSVDRANAVKQYLENKGVTVRSSKGNGVSHGDTTNRLVHVTIAE